MSLINKIRLIKISQNTKLGIVIAYSATIGAIVIKGAEYIKLHI